MNNQKHVINIVQFYSKVKLHTVTNLLIRMNLSFFLMNDEDQGILTSFNK
jgi:hypothetical protein